MMFTCLLNSSGLWFHLEEKREFFFFEIFLFVCLVFAYAFVFVFDYRSLIM